MVMDNDLFENLPPRNQWKRRQELIRHVLDSIGDGGQYKGDRISNWYLGAIKVICDRNSECIAQSAHSLREVIEKIPLVEMKKDYSNKEQQHERIQDVIKLTDPLIASLGSEALEKKIRSLNDLRKKFVDISHHEIISSLDIFTNDIHELEEMIFDLFAPVTEKNQEEIERILTLTRRNRRDEEHLLSLIEKRGANNVFFFREIIEKKNATWLNVVRARGYFNNPPPVEQLDNKIKSTPVWLPIRYLASIANIKPEETVEIVLQLPVVDNQVTCYKIVEIAHTLPINYSLKIKSKVFEYLTNNSVLWGDSEAKLLDYWIKDNQIISALEILEVLVGFTPNDLRKNTLRMPLLEQGHRMDRYFYHQLMKGSVRSLIEKAPYETTNILIKATSEMFQLGICGEESYTVCYFWDKSINKQQSDIDDSRGHEEMLINTMVFACEKVYEKQSNKIMSLDELLCNENWDIFRRVRIHLYEKYPCKDNKHSIRKLILEYERYGKFPFGDGFQCMIKSACRYFGKELLSEEEGTQIFLAISKEPSRDDFLKQCIDDDPSDEDFQQFKDDICRSQFLAFECVLPDKYANKLQVLKDSFKETPPKRYTFPPDRGTWSPLSDRSYFSSDELAKLTDPELLARINNWQEEIHDYEDENLITFNIRGLSQEFQKFFNSYVISNHDRLSFWLQNYKNIERPIYVETMLKVSSEQLQKKELDNINQWLDVCDWVLSHPNKKRDDGIKGREFRDNPDWSSTWWGICSFVYTYLQKNNEPNYLIRQRLLAIVEVLCTHYDSSLDCEESGSSLIPDLDFDDVGDKRDIAILALIHIAYIAKKCHSKSELSTMKNIIDQRLSSEELPLKPREYAMLGRHYLIMYDLDKEWTKDHASSFFPKSKKTEWMAAFKSFVIYSRPCEAMFEITKDYISFAIHQLKKVKRGYPQQKTIHDALAKRLFDLYYHGWCSLKNKDSLLGIYYKKVTFDPYYRGNLLCCIGRALCDDGKKIDRSSIKMIVEFFEWRLEEGDFSNTRYFTPWLCAKCLDEKYRLQSCLKVLKNCELDLSSTDVWLRKFCEMLPNQTKMVVECFKELTYFIRNSNAQYIDKSNAKNIIFAGINHKDKTVQDNANIAHDNLLKKGLISQRDIKVSVLIRCPILRGLL